jgi:uncharacterized protein (TIGR04255 family)
VCNNGNLPCKAADAFNFQNGAVMSEYLPFTLAHIEFSPIPETTFNNKTDELLEELRERYPIFQEKELVKQVDVRLGDNAVNIEERTHPLVKMSSSDRSFGIRISTNHVTLHTVNYKNFSDFKLRFLEILKICKETFSIYNYSFLGIRYINRFTILNEDFSKYYFLTDFLQPDLNGWSKGGSNHNTGYLTNADTKINIQGGVSINSRLLPGEIFALTSDLISENPIVEGLSTFLDIDSFHASGDDTHPEFNITTIEEKLDVLRTKSREALNAIIKTEELGMV